ncbi:MAG: hypothetical protein H6Q31_2783, partial [Bacteroidetes bacterium]|nr:hypothetical protein [Bacteroidota bacterium]
MAFRGAVLFRLHPESHEQGGQHREDVGLQDRHKQLQEIDGNNKRNRRDRNDVRPEDEDQTDQ